MIKRMYTSMGQEVEVIEKTTTGYLGRQIVLSGTEYEESSEDILFFEKLFDTAPVTKFNEEILKLQKEIENLNDDIELRREELLKIDSEHQKQIKKFKNDEVLKYIEMFLDGTITHAVVLCSWNPQIKEISKWESTLCLKRNESGFFEWRIDDSNLKVMPCISIEEARNILQKFVDKQIKDNTLSSDFNGKEHNIKLPDDFIRSCKENKKIRYLQEIKNREEIIKEYQSKIKELEEN